MILIKFIKEKFLKVAAILPSKRVRRIPEKIFTKTEKETIEEKKIKKEEDTSKNDNKSE